jgi:hypothetical protein
LTSPFQTYFSLNLKSKLSSAERCSSDENWIYWLNMAPQTVKIRLTCRSWGGWFRNNLIV